MNALYVYLVSSSTFDDKLPKVQTVHSASHSHQEYKLFTANHSCTFIAMCVHPAAPPSDIGKNNSRVNYLDFRKSLDCEDIISYQTILTRKRSCIHLPNFYWRAHVFHFYTHFIPHRLQFLAVATPRCIKLRRKYIALKNKKKRS